MGLEKEILVEGICCRGNKILLVRESYPPKWWNLPGGKVEAGEKAVDAIVREFQEELNLVIKPQRLVAIRDRGDQLAFIFEVRAAADSSIEPDGEEIIGVQWIEEAALASDLNLSDLARQAIEAWFLGESSLAAVSTVTDRRGVDSYLYL